MAREVIIASWCDVCLIDDDQRTESVRSLTISWSGVPRPQEIDVCEKHSDVISAFMIMMDKYGRPADTDSRAKPSQPTLPTEKRKRAAKPGGIRQQRLASQPGSLGCPECLALYSPGENGALYKYIAQHLLRQHGTSVTNYTDEQLREATEKAYAAVKATIAA